MRKQSKTAQACVTSSDSSSEEVGDQISYLGFLQLTESRLQTCCTLAGVADFSWAVQYF